MFERDLVYGKIYSPLVPTKVVTANVVPGAGAGVDTLGLDGGIAVFQNVGLPTAGVSLAGKLQHSDDNATWVDIPGATFTPVTMTAVAQVIQIDKTNVVKRYVAYAATVSGTSYPVAVTLIGSKKSEA